MIFVTVGTQLPFDRLIRVVDQWAKEHRYQDICAQIADSCFVAEYISTHKFLTPPEYRRLFSSAELIISHAGVGSILMALECEKPIIVMPRCAALHEHRNGHQLGTAKRFAEMGYVTPAYSDHELRELLNQHQEEKMTRREPVGESANGDIFNAIREFLTEAEIAFKNKKNLLSLKRI